MHKCNCSKRKNRPTFIYLSAISAAKRNFFLRISAVTEQRIYRHKNNIKQRQANGLYGMVVLNEPFVTMHRWARITKTYTLNFMNTVDPQIVANFKDNFSNCRIY